MCLTLKPFEVEEQLFYPFTNKIEALINVEKWCSCIMKMPTASIR